MFNDIINEASGEVYPVYVIMSHSGSTLSHLIRKATGQPYSHASVSFDSSLKNMYSFGSGKLSRINYIVGGLAKEDFKDFSLFDPNTTYSLYVTFVTRDERDGMLDKLAELTSKNATKELKYNFIGLLYNAFNVAHEKSDVYFCSQFVNVILQSGNRGFDKHSTLVRPADFAKLKTFQFITRGLSGNYDAEKVKQKVATMGVQADQIIMYESDMSYNGGFMEINL